MLKKPLTDVIVQGHYMSGDRNTIATALGLESKLGILLLGPTGEDDRSKDLAEFYQKKAPGRIELRQVPKGPHATALDAVKAAYQEVAEYTRDRKNPKPHWLRDHVADDVTVQPATHATSVIACGFQQKRGPKTQQRIRELWRLPGDLVQQDAIQRQVWRWLLKKGFRNDRAYVFFFAKLGSRTAEKAHHFTSILTWHLLAERVGRETSIIPVAMGDDIGLRTTPTLVRFWDDPEWQDILGGRIDNRSAQLGMWCFLAEEFGCLSILGMRSGMLEVPALLGIRTLYLEEKHNDQANRMIKWEDKGDGKGVPGWTRQEVNRPPGIAQQKYWHQDGLKNSEKSKTRAHVTTEGAHAANLVYGIKNPQQAASAVFGPQPLAGNLIPAEKFQLATGEFDSIVEWIKRTPRPSIATDHVHGSVPGTLETRDIVKQDLSAKKQGQSWSEYFASEDYRKSLPGLSWKSMK